MRRSIRKRRFGALRWMWVLLLPLPPLVGYAESGDPIRAMTEISNRAAKGDRLPIAHASEAAWLSCAPLKDARENPRCAALAGTN